MRPVTEKSGNERSRVWWAFALMLLMWTIEQLLETRFDIASAFHPIEIIPPAIFSFLISWAIVAPLCRFLVRRGYRSLITFLVAGLVVGWAGFGAYYALRVLADRLELRPILMGDFLHRIGNGMFLNVVFLFMSALYWLLVVRSSTCVDATQAAREE